MFVIILILFVLRGSLLGNLNIISFEAYSLGFVWNHKVVILFQMVVGIVIVLFGENYYQNAFPVQY